MGASDLAATQGLTGCVALDAPRDSIQSQQPPNPTRPHAHPTLQEEGHHTLLAGSQPLSRAAATLTLMVCSVRRAFHTLTFPLLGVMTFTSHTGVSRRLTYSARPRWPPDHWGSGCGLTGLAGARGKVGGGQQQWRGADTAQHKEWNFFANDTLTRT